MSRKIFYATMDIDPDRRCVADLNGIAKAMDSAEALSLIGKEAFFEYTVFASEDDVSDEMLKEIFFTDSISEDLYYVCVAWDTPVKYIDVKTMTDPDTGLTCLLDIMEYSDKDDVFIATSRSNYVIMASASYYQSCPSIVLHVWDLRKSSIFH